MYIPSFVTIIGPSKSHVEFLNLLKLLFHIVEPVGFEYVSEIMSQSWRVKVVDVGELNPPSEALLYVAVTVTSTSEILSGNLKYEFP